MMAIRKPDALRRFFSWPLVLGIIFFIIPVSLMIAYPVSFWLVTDNETHGLANATNIAYRLADLQMYPAIGLTNHPGVTFYLMSWFALALSGYPLAVGSDFFGSVIAHVETYHVMIIVLAALVGAAGTYIFVRTAQAIAPISVVFIALLIWLVSSPATILMFLSPGFESFAMLINALFLAVVVELAKNEDTDWPLMVFAGSVGALAYLNKLSYIYIPLALGGTIVAKLVLTRVRWTTAVGLTSLFIFSLLSVVLAVAFVVIGWHEFGELLDFHRGVILGSGLYGEGEQVVVSGDEVSRAIAAIPRDEAYAIPIAIVAGLLLTIAGLVTGFMRGQRMPALLSIAAGSAALVSAVSVLKHYDIHYTAGVSATLPACVVAGYRLSKAWSGKVRAVYLVAVAGAALSMAGPVAAYVAHLASSRLEATKAAQADLKEILRLTANQKGATYFAYKTPFPQYGEGFSVYFSGVPRLKYEYLRGRTEISNPFVDKYVNRNISTYVIDKGYFPRAEDIMKTDNFGLLGARPIRYQAGDRLIELQTVFLLMRG